MTVISIKYSWCIKCLVKMDYWLIVNDIYTKVFPYFSLVRLFSTKFIFFTRTYFQKIESKSFLLMCRATFEKLFYTKEMKYSWGPINVWEWKEKWNSRAEGAGGGKWALPFPQPKWWNKEPPSSFLCPSYIHLCFHPCIHSSPCYLLLCI